MIRSVPHPIEILFGNGSGLACGLDGEIRAEELHGLFCGDTRVLSTWRFSIAGYPWRILSRIRSDASTLQWDMQNPSIRIPGFELQEGMIHCRLRRRVSGALHDDLSVCSYTQRSIPVRLSLQLDADFADLFQVKSHSTPPRLKVGRIPTKSGVSFIYEHRDFKRELEVSLSASNDRISLAGSRFVFDIMLEPHKRWTCCVEAVPKIGTKRMEFKGDPHGTGRNGEPERSPLLEADPVLSAPFARSIGDLTSLALEEGQSEHYLAAGAPWFLALFGRDTLVTSLMTSLMGLQYARGALSSLEKLQARERDDFRDAEPGKIAHELRHGELAHFKMIPHTPYYGTHDAPALYVLALWNAFRWTGDRELLNQHLPAAKAALQWCETEGDSDRDGLLEYTSRSSSGYRNQSWKDAGDAIVHSDGNDADPPIATVELQGYWFAALLAMSELLQIVGERRESERLRNRAAALRRVVELRFWMEDVGCYAMALDREKRLVRSISSNPGHLLWCGLPSVERARRVAARFFAADMFSGYGIRTLSAEHRRYNPLSYQLGSVWPHDNALAAAGLMRYGLRDEAAKLLKGILDAAGEFEHYRLPELFCGFPRDEGGPVPYEQANVPQAWAAAVPILAAQLFIGLIPDVSGGRCFISPWLPDWLPKLEMKRIRIGDGDLEISLRRSGSATRIEHVSHPTLEVTNDRPIAVLWGNPQPDLSL